MPEDIKTFGYVLRRTNYGEADRILNVITPVGKKSVMAKGVRRSKSRLAGGIEMFTLSEMGLHKGRGDLWTLTSARMVRFYDKLLVDWERMECATTVLKKVSQAAEHSDNAEFFEITDQSLAGLGEGMPGDLVMAWFWLNLAKATGEQVNLYRDTSGEQLAAERRYEWNAAEEALGVCEGGAIDANAIKIMRLMVTGGLGVVQRVKGVERYTPEILRIAQAVGKK